MKKNTSNKILVLFALLSFAACKAKKAVLVTRKAVDTVAAKPATRDNAAELKRAKLAAIKSKQVEFNTFSARAQAKLDINGDNNNVTLNFRVLRDKKIWVSVTAIAGIEVARALITPDSIQVINRWQGVYLKKPFSYVYQYASREVSYKTVEAILVGNAIPQVLTEKSELKPDAGNILLTGALQELMYRLVIGPDLKVSQTNLSNAAQGQSLTADNSVFIMEANRVIPSQVNISSATKDKKILINLHYSKVEFDQPLDYQFVIPGKYTRAD